MGYTKVGCITNFEPDADDETLYFADGVDLTEIIDAIYEKWGCAASDVTISAEHIHTRCLTYDQYDAGDYDDYIVVRKK